MHGHLFQFVPAGALFTSFHTGLLIRSEEMKYTSFQFPTCTESRIIGRTELTHNWTEDRENTSILLNAWNS